ncbi:MAG: rod shape-determining protein [Thermodesulfobacteriota bacterium]
MLSLVEKFVPPPCVAIDLGTANTRIYDCGLETIAEEPSLVQHLVDGEEGCPDEYIAHLNSQFVSAPLRGGVVVDVSNAISLLRPLLRRSRHWLRQPATLACAPTDTSERERRLLTDALLGAGAAHVAIIPEPWAAAIGAGLDVTAPSAQLLIDIGQGVTDLAVIRDSRLVYTSAVRTACHDLQQAIKNAILSRHRVALYPEDLETLTHELGALLDPEPAEPCQLTLRGMDLIRRRQVELTVRQAEIVGAMEPVLAKILRTIETSLRRLPERFAAEICASGICLTGGGSCITGIDRLIAARTNLAVRVAPDPQRAVINGAGQTLHFWKERDAAWWESITWPSLAA